MKVSEAEGASNQIMEDYLTALQDAGDDAYADMGEPSSADGEAATPVSSGGANAAPSKKVQYDRAKKKYFEARKKYHRMNAKLEKLKMLREN